MCDTCNERGTCPFYEAGTNECVYDDDFESHCGVIDDIDVDHDKKEVCIWFE